MKILISKEYKELYLIIILLLVIRFFVIESFRIPSSSMQPTLLIGDFIFVNKFIYGIKIPFIKKNINIKKPERGDVVVFKKKDDKKNYIKRIIGIENDKIIYKKKNIYINNIKIKKKIKSKEINLDKKYKTIKILNLKEYLNPKKEYYIKNYEYNTQKYNFENLTVPKNSYFLIGDNRDNSEDSRFWGFIQKDEIKGKAFIIWISIDTKNIDIRWNRILKYIK